MAHGCLLATSSFYFREEGCICSKSHFISQNREKKNVPDKDLFQHTGKLVLSDLDPAELSALGISFNWTVTGLTKRLPNFVRPS